MEATFSQALRPWLPALFAIVLAGASTAAVAQDRDNLPIPDPAFKGKIGKTIRESTPDYPQPVKAPAGAPNVLLILLDDVGFGMTSTFGGPVPTPNLDKLAKDGLSYTSFTPPLCAVPREARS